MIIAAIKIHKTEFGISIEQLSLTDQSNAHSEERLVAGILDIGLKCVMEFVGTHCGKGTMIEGKEIEKHVSDFLEKHHAKSFATQLKELGVKLPPQR